MTYMLLLNCALKLVEEIILYCDARAKKHQMTKAAVALRKFANASERVEAIRVLTNLLAVCVPVSTAVV